jgi:hypothetical protein
MTDAGSMGATVEIGNERIDELERRIAGMDTRFNNQTINNNNAEIAFRLRITKLEKELSERASKEELSQAIAKEASNRSNSTQFLQQSDLNKAMKKEADDRKQEAQDHAVVARINNNRIESEFRQRQEQETTTREQAIDECNRVITQNEGTIYTKMGEMCYKLMNEVKKNIAERDTEFDNQMAAIDQSLARLQNDNFNSGIRENKMNVTISEIDKSIQRNHRQSVTKIGLINTSLTAIADARQTTLQARTLRHTSRKKPPDTPTENDREIDEMMSHDQSDSESIQDSKMPATEEQDDNGDASPKSDDDNGSSDMEGSETA